MKKRFSVKQIVAVLKQAEGDELVRRLRIVGCERHCVYWPDGSAGK